MIFPSQNTSHKVSNLLLIQNYHFTSLNRQIFYCRKIVRKFADVTGTIMENQKLNTVNPFTLGNLKEEDQRAIRESVKGNGSTKEFGKQIRYRNREIKMVALCILDIQLFPRFEIHHLCAVCTLFFESNLIQQLKLKMKRMRRGQETPSPFSFPPSLPLSLFFFFKLPRPCIVIKDMNALRHSYLLRQKMN